METLGRIFGPLTDLISGVLEFFHAFGAPWWLSVVLLTVLVRGALLPLTVRQVKNMRAMQSLRPAMDEIRARHKKEPRRQQEAMAELYREHKVNPLAGFVPLLIQMPIFIIMYRVIRVHEETFPGFASGGLLWFADLTKADPYFVLPVLSASLMMASGRISARNVAPSQRRTMLLMPLVFTAFIFRFPAGLFVYWITSNAFTLAQNFFIYRHEPAAVAVPEGEGPKKAPAKSEGKTDKAKTGPKKPARRRKKKRRR
ncbi:MAG: YidC/Oxa1 family membrane protein insertase [Actinomycetota bacterium]|nr:YidC/Oxa1 family membrane protein insertase [Actinomycetota bacterium]